jgi:hypothetical protein
MSTILEQVLTHFEFLGYEIDKKDEVIIAKYRDRFQYHVNEFEYGILLSMYLILNSQGTKNIGTVLERVNEFNKEARVSRCTLINVDNIPFLSIEAYFPNAYEKSAFGIFLDTLYLDVMILGKEKSNLREYLG